MTKKEEMYKCLICGNLVKVVESGAGTLVCCGEDMKLLEEHTEEGLSEKHIPIIEKTDNSVIVRVGEVSHPMTEEHYIKWIEVNIDGSVYVMKLKPGDEPVAEFKGQGYKVGARCLCNLHGLWKSK